MTEFDSELFKKQRKTLTQGLQKLPKFLQWVIFSIYTICALMFGYLGGKNNISLNNFIHIERNIFSFGGKVAGTETDNSSPPLVTCVVKFCSDFLDDTWLNFDRFQKIQDDPLILKSPNTPALPGATMFFNNDVENFSANIFITPEATTSANLVVAWGHFIRCIIGDGDYSKVSCQINEDYPKKIEAWSYMDNEGELHGKNLRYQLSSFSPNQELQIKFEIEKVGDDKIISLKLNDHVPLLWKFPKGFIAKTKIERVGVGLFTTRYDDVQAVFKKFQLDPHL